jgi:hypothetical protein
MIRTYGILCAISAIALICIYWANRTAANHGRADLYIALYALGLLILAGGLLAAKVWAELLFVLCLLLFVIGELAALAIDRARLSDISFSLVILALLMIPVLLSIRWLWRGEYFQRGT